MGAWDDLTLAAARVRQAHRTTRLVTPDGGGGYAFVPGVEATAPEAKALVETELVARIGRHVAAYGSPEAMMDALAAEPRLADSLQTALAYGLLHAEHFAGRNSNRDVYDADAEHYMERLKRAASAIAATAPHVLGLTGRTGRPRGGAIASTMSTYDRL